MHDLHRAPRAVPVVLARPRFLGVEEGGLVLRVGERPGDPGVVPDQDPGQAGHADPGDVEARRGQGDLVPDRRNRLRQVRVAGQQRTAPLHRRPAGRPRVAVRVLVQVAGRELAELGQQGARRLRSRRGRARTSRGTRRGPRASRAGRKPGSEPGRERGQRELAIRAGVVGGLRVLGDDREPVHGADGAEGALEQRVVKRGRGEIEFLGEVALDDQAVDGGPGRRVHAGEGEHRRPLTAGADLRDVIVDALGVGGQRAGGQAVLRHLRPLHLGGTEQAQAQLEFVRRQVLRAGQLGQPPLPQAALLVHFGQPELRVQVAEREEHVVVAGGPDGGDALRGERDGDGVPEPGQAQGLRAHRLAARRRRPRAAAGIERRAQRGDRAVPEPEHAQQHHGHHERGDDVGRPPEPPAPTPTPTTQLGHQSGGCLSFHGRACSSWADREIRVASSPIRPASITPIGRPSAFQCSGTFTAGWPDTL